MSHEPSNNEKPRRQRFRSYHRAQERRRKAQLQDERFARAVFSLAGVAAAVALIFGFFASQGRFMDPATATELTEPVLGPLSLAHILGFGFIFSVAGLFLWRTRKRK